MRDIYFAITTLIFSQIFYVIIFTWTEVTGGENGLTFSRPPLAIPGLFSVRFTPNTLHWFVLGVVVLSYLLLRRITQSHRAAAHPLPDASSERAGAAALEFASRAGPGDLLLLALSGGASALMAAPADPVTLADKIAINAALLGSGASIRELNVVRRHISAIKGGGLLRACGGARVLSLILSDVARNDLGNDRLGTDRRRSDEFHRRGRRA